MNLNTQAFGGTLLTLCTYFLLSPILHAQTNEPTSKRTEEIALIYVADQKTRSLFCKKCGHKYDRKEERISDAQRRMRLFEMMVDDLPWSANELFYASTILQSTDSIDTGVFKTRTQKYMNQENHLLAFYLARRSYLMGQKLAAPLIVKTIDSYLLTTKKPKNLGLILKSTLDINEQKICLRSPQISDELRMKKEFPFALASAIKGFC
jgi:hypothetical protein